MFRNNIYYQVFMYIMDFIGILSIIYIKLNENIFKLCIGQYNIENNIDINYLFLFIGIVILKNFFLFKYKEIGGVIFTLTKFILNIFSGGLILFSYKLYQLQTDYIDSIRLKLNLYIHRNWNDGELREYLLDRLLNDTTILDKLKNLEIKLPFSDKVTSNLLADCKTIDDVNKSVDSFIAILEYNKETLAKARILDESSTDTGYSIIEQIKTSSLISSITSSLVNANIYFLLGGLALSVLTLAGLYYGFNSNIISLAKETKVIKKGLVHSLELEKKNTENNEKIEETLSNLTTFSNNTITQIGILKDNDKELMSSFAENREQVQTLSKLVESCMGQLESVNKAVSQIPVLDNTELRKLVLGIVLEALEMPAPDTLGKDVNAGDTPETGSASTDSTSSVKGTGRIIKRFGNIHTFGD